MFRSDVSKFILGLGLISIVISILRNFSYQRVLIQIILYSLIARDADCMVYGKCHIASWTIIVVPIIGIIVFTMDYLHLFDKYKEKINKLHDKMERLNGIDLDEYEKC